MGGSGLPGCQRVGGVVRCGVVWEGVFERVSLRAEEGLGNGDGKDRRKEGDECE